MNGDSGYAAIQVGRKSGDERFMRNGQPLEATLLGFWRWSASDLVSNATRGVLAEYIVASALGIAEGVRAEWDAFDLRTRSGIKLEVKSAAYLQSWFHRKLSTIQFDIRATREWAASTSELSADVRRQADVYVFCVLNHKEKHSLDPLNLDQWEFYILPASILNAECPTQKTIGLTRLLELGPCRARYEEIASCIERVGDRTGSIT